MVAAALAALASTLFLLVRRRAASRPPEILQTPAPGLPEVVRDQPSPSRFLRRVKSTPVPPGWTSAFGVWRFVSKPREDGSNGPTEIVHAESGKLPYGRLLFPAPHPSLLAFMSAKRKLDELNRLHKKVELLAAPVRSSPTLIGGQDLLLLYQYISMKWEFVSDLMRGVEAATNEMLVSYRYASAVKVTIRKKECLVDVADVENKADLDVRLLEALPRILGVTPVSAASVEWRGFQELKNLRNSSTHLSSEFVRTGAKDAYILYRDLLNRPPAVHLAAALAIVKYYASSASPFFCEQLDSLFSPT